MEIDLLELILKEHVYTLYIIPTKGLDHQTMFDPLAATISKTMPTKQQKQGILGHKIRHKEGQIEFNDHQNLPRLSLDIIKEAYEAATQVEVIFPCDASVLQQGHPAECKLLRLRTFRAMGKFLQDS